MRWPFVSRTAYDMALRVAEGAQRHAENMEALATREAEKSVALFDKVQELTDKIVSMKRENFVVETPITHSALSVDEADEFSTEEDHATRQAMLKRRLG
jgi:hypothetical protein